MQKTKVAVLAALFVLLSASAVLNQPRQPVNHVTVTVQQGDTLWQIAGRYIQPGQNIQEVMYNIRRANPGKIPGGMVLVGEKLIVPVPVRMEEK